MSARTVACACLVMGLLSAAPAGAGVTANLDDLPVIAVPPSNGGHGRMAILLSGDGGWTGLPQSVAAALARDGIGVAGLNSLKYFWTLRTADETARDIERIADYYQREWHADRIVLIGYSFGADVLTIVTSRLRQDLRKHIEGLSLIAPSSVANFEVQVTGWLGVRHPGPPTLPALERPRGPADGLHLRRRRRRRSLPEPASRVGADRKAVGRASFWRRFRRRCPASPALIAWDPACLKIL